MSAGQRWASQKPKPRQKAREREIPNASVYSRRSCRFLLFIDIFVYILLKYLRSSIIYLPWDIYRNIMHDDVITDHGNLRKWSVHYCSQGWILKLFLVFLHGHQKWLYKTIAGKNPKWDVNVGWSRVYLRQVDGPPSPVEGTFVATGISLVWTRLKAGRKACGRIVKPIVGGLTRPLKQSRRVACPRWRGTSARGSSHMTSRRRKRRRRKEEELGAQGEREKRDYSPRDRIIL